MALWWLYICFKASVGSLARKGRVKVRKPWGERGRDEWKGEWKAEKWRER